ncbi:MAG TPA: hypothetical protein VN255_06555, partial [Mycobacterium sp.]|nr:hypothetical protein [Mycobacterium sp.]
MRRLFIVTVIALAVAAGAPVAASADTGQHPAITITSDSQFTAPGSKLGGCQCVTAGDGSTGNPYVIGPWAIKVPSGVTSGWAIKVDNSGGGVTRSFTISGIAANYSGVQPPDPVIWLVDVNNANGTTISNVSANEDGRGVELDYSSYINLDQLSFNKMNGTGLYIMGSPTAPASYIKLSNSK